MKLAFYLSDFPIYYLPWLCQILDSLANQHFIIDLYLNNAGSKLPLFSKNVSIIELSANQNLLEHKHENKSEFSFPPFAYLLPQESVQNIHLLSKNYGYDFCIGLESRGLLLAKIASDASDCPLAYLNFELYLSFI